MGDVNLQTLKLESTAIIRPSSHLSNFKVCKLTSPISTFPVSAPNPFPTPALGRISKVTLSAFEVSTLHEAMDGTEISSMVALQAWVWLVPHPPHLPAISLNMTNTKLAPIFGFW